MAKEYKAKLTLQDNWTKVMDTAISKTGKLLKEAQKIEKMKINPEVNIKTNKTLMKQLEKDLNKLKESNINIKTKLDSSFKSIVNAIEKAVPAKKVVNITARENVTKTLNNVEREVFTRTNKVSNIIKGSFSGIGNSISSSLGGATSTLSNFINRMNTASNVASVLSRNRNTSGSNIATAIAGGNLLSSALAGGTSGLVAGGILSRRNNRGLSIPINAKFEGFLDSFSKIASKMKGTMGKAFKDVANNAKLQFEKAKLGITLPFEDEAIAKRLNVNAWSGGSEFAKMINNQKLKMASLGVDNYLPQYKTVSTPTPFTDENDNYVEIETMIKDKGKIQKFFEGIPKLAKSAGEKIKTFLGNAVTQIKATALYQRFAPVFSKIANKASIVGNKIKFAFQRGVYGASATLAKLIVAGANVGSRVSTAFSKLSSAIPGPIKKGVSLGVTAIKKITSATAKIAGKTFKFTVKALDKATTVIKGIASKALGLAKIGLGALTVGATVGVKGLAEKESNLVSIQHFMGVADKANGGNASEEQLNNQANAYFENLQNLANTTPFENADINKAGTRAIQMANGNTDYAMTMTKLAADMSALNPGTTASDAMEALFDAKLGEFERLKTFGLKVSQKDFKALVGKGENDDLTEEETEQAFQKLVNGDLQTTFQGGAEKLSDTLGGKFSTVTGKLKKGLSDVAEAFAPKMKGALDKTIGFMDNLFAKDSSGNFTNGFVKGIVSGVENAITYVSKLITAFKDIWPQVQQAIEPLKQAFSNIFSGVSMDGLINGIVGALSSLINFATPIISAFAGIIETITPIAMEVAGKVIKAFESIAPAFSTVVEMVTPVLEFFMNIFGLVADFITENSDIINEIVATIGDIWEKVWGAFSTVLKVAWDIISPILSALLDLLGWVLDKINGFLDGIGKVGSWIGDKWNDFSNWISGGDGDSRAVGMDTVPYDNYKINAHRGEMLLTRAEANQYKSEKNRNNQTNNKNMNVVINVNGNSNAEHVATIVYDKLMQASLNMA